MRISQVNTLYVGTTEDVAKLSPVRGLTPPTFFTDVYTGFFCKTNRRWGVVAVDITKLCSNLFAPTPAFLESFDKRKNKTLEEVENRRKKIFDRLLNYRGNERWKSSLRQTGVCVYLLKIPPTAIRKVIIYDQAYANPFINKLVEEQNPYGSFYAHKRWYKQNTAINRWLNGEVVKSDEFEDITKDDDINNRAGLECFYIRKEKGLISQSLAS